jgi:heptosyltransferase-2
MVVRPKANEIAACIPGVDTVHVFDKRGKDRSWFALKTMAKALGRPEIVFVPHPSIRSALLAWYSGAPIRIGTRHGWAHRILYTNPVPKRPKAPYVEQFLDLGRALGLEAAFPRMRLRVPVEYTENARQIVGKSPSVGLIIGSEWPTKRWPAEKFAKLADGLVLQGFQPVLLGAPNEKLLAEEVKTAMASVALDLVGNTISESIGVIHCLRGVVGGDTGLSHVARALGIPAVLLFGPTDPAKHIWEVSSRAISTQLKCQPCHPHGPKRCSLLHHNCMSELNVSLVQGTLLELIKQCRRVA